MAGADGKPLILKPGSNLIVRRVKKSFVNLNQSVNFEFENEEQLNVEELTIIPHQEQNQTVRCHESEDDGICDSFKGQIMETPRKMIETEDDPIQRGCDGYSESFGLTREAASFFSTIDCNDDLNSASSEQNSTASQPANLNWDDK